MNNTATEDRNKALVIQALKQLSEIYKALTRDNNPRKENILEECFEKAGIEIPKYKSYMAKTDFFHFNKGDILTFRLINTPILKDLGIYLVGVGESLYITYYNEKKKAFVIDEDKAPIPKDKATIEGILSNVEAGCTNE